VTHCPPRDFQPMKANMGILPELPPQPGRTGKRERAALYAERAMRVLDEFLAGVAGASSEKS
ncbi:MAG: hypothetical protein AB7S36_13785, partial [Planctomycetota bacterium]